jgi:hypothetical protein
MSSDKRREAERGAEQEKERRGGKGDILMNLPFSPSPV